ncbi:MULTISPECIES: glucuronate isomerase [Subtercola]|uniref:Uronate isomerase n=1 Tax=Subtercola vilae TaxID=2056433 RepID=A0A4T2CBP0_9MICO|nr:MULTISPECIES: glucuronate isomerase [Subtercola]MEA9983852.1 glucuronate isomerase [Subtercola sp. RTI3]TIH40751.1 glucuronate isomerase [Subtercola vilae]
MPELRLHPDRMLTADPSTRAVARRLYATVADAPIVSPHGHVDPALFVTNRPFANPAELFITPDHYVTRLLHSLGVGLDALGLDPSDPAADRRAGARTGPAVPALAPGPTAAQDARSRAAWRELARVYPKLAGTPVRYWLDDQLAGVFGLEEQPSEANADAQYDELSAKLALPEFSPRRLLARSGIDVLATTDAPADDLGAHQALALHPGVRAAVVPTFRADRYFDPSEAGWPASLEALAEASGIDTSTYRGVVAALRDRRQYFARHGATSTDSGVVDAWAVPLDEGAAEGIHRRALSGPISEADATAYRRNMLYRMAEMSADDGLVMQLHAGVLRNHHAATFDRFGPDTGHDLPVSTEFTRPLQTLLNHFGTNPAFRLVLFTVDETSFARDIAPLAGFYPSVFVGAPWWFLDTPDAMRRFREAATDSAGFYKTSGFIDDTRALCSIGARHDLSRRIDAGHLASLVVRHQLTEDEATVIAVDLVDSIPTSTFRLEDARSRP